VIADNEPRQLYNLTQFIISDKEGRGVMTLQDAMQILYLRHGRAQLDEQLVKLFGTSDLRTGKVLTLREFLHALHSQQVSWRPAIWCKCQEKAAHLLDVCMTIF
jgi:hypothetical protein